MIRVRVNWTGLTQGFSVFHFSDDLANAQTVADATSAWVADTAVVRKTTQLGQVDSEVTQINIATGETEAVATVTSSSSAGNLGGDALPNAAMVLVRWRTGVFNAGRELRGRTFIPGGAVDILDASGNLDPASIALMNTANDDLHQNTDVGIYSPTHSMFATIESSSTWSEFAVLRSRR